VLARRVLSAIAGAAAQRARVALCARHAEGGGAAERRALPGAGLPGVWRVCHAGRAAAGHGDGAAPAPAPVPAGALYAACEHSEDAPGRVVQVRETIETSALLRLPLSVSRADKDKIVEEIIDQLVRARPRRPA